MVFGPNRQKLDRIWVHFVVEGDHLTDAVLDKYESHIDGQWQAIVRFDEAHWYGHRPCRGLFPVWALKGKLMVVFLPFFICGNAQH
jgi:hypothetical protein